MNAQDMTALFNPVPFGEVRESPLQRVLEQSPQLWDRLRNIDMDKEAAVLQVRIRRRAAREHAPVWRGCTVSSASPWPDGICSVCGNSAWPVSLCAEVTAATLAVRARATQSTSACGVAEVGG
jgi:hypothetical protein